MVDEKKIKNPIILTLSLQTAKDLQFYLLRSYFRIGEYEVANIIAEEALCDNKNAKRVLDVRRGILRELRIKTRRIQ